MEIPEKYTDIYEATKEVLEKLLELMDLPAAVNLSEEFTVFDEEGDISSIGFNIEGEDLGIIIGRRGQTMVSLQYVVRLIIAHRMEVRLPIVLDVEGYKQRRCEGLRNLALRLAEQVKTRKAPFSMEPMPAFERRVVHLALVDHPDVTTESTGFGDSRKVVIIPKKLPDS
jgi:spoIIIJ-associated protein